MQTVRESRVVTCTAPIDATARAASAAPVIKNLFMVESLLRLDSGINSWVRNGLFTRAG
jgi:hypothetical protein